MKKIILPLVALMATLFCASTASAQGIKIYKQGGEVIDIPAAQLDYIEAYDATEAGPAFEGTWKMRKLVTDKDYMLGMWGAFGINYDQGFPAFNADDELTFKDGKLTVNLKSDFKNFFIGEATYEVLPGAYAIHAGVGATIDLTILKVTGVNRNFDAASTSENNVAYIGVREIDDEDADEPGHMLLDVYLIDYESTSFAPELMEFGMYMPDMDGNPYMAYQSGLFINFLMEKK